jgi:acyl dehydratase
MMRLSAPARHHLVRWAGTNQKETPMPIIDDYEVLGLGLHFEDLPVGRKFRTIGRTLTEADLVNFIGVTGLTEVLFSNLEFLKNESDIKQRVVPASMVYCFAEGLLVHATMQHTGFAFLNMELDVKAPTFAGDTIHVECEVVENRRSSSRPNRGLVRTFNYVRKQDGTVVLTYNPLRMVRARGTGE